jgi:hypothetical protein
MTHILLEYGGCQQNKTLHSLPVDPDQQDYIHTIMDTQNNLLSNTSPIEKVRFKSCYTSMSSVQCVFLCRCSDLCFVWCS